MPFTLQPLRTLLVAHDDVHSQAIRRVLAESATARFEVEHASSGWEAQRLVAAGTYAALVLDDSLSDVDGETLLGRLRALGVVAPALFVTSTDNDQVPAAADDYLPKADVLTGNSLARALLAMVQRHDLTQELAVARYQAERATTALAGLTDDLATPLGVVMGTTDALLSEDNGLNAEGRSYLEDVAREALRACAILRQVNLSEASPGPALQAPVVSRPISAGPGSKTVLVADDDAGTRRLVAATLDSDQYSVLEAADGKEAWRLIREHHPAVAILDWQMPIYSGLELTDVIKGDPRFRDMTVILLTGRSTQADREAGARAHADLYLIKPFLPHELLAGVEQALRVS